MPASLALLLASGSATAAVPADEIAEEWDINALKRLGLPTDALERLDRLDRIPPGVNVVDISLNGDFIGSFQLEVSPEGTICFTPQLLSELGLDIPAAARDQPCFDWVGSNSHISAVWQQETQSLSLVAPSALLAVPPLGGETGGSAARINYNFYSSVNRSPGRSQRSSWLMLDSGVNLANWMLRSQQNFQQTEAGLTSTVSSTYLERYISRLNKTLQAGEIAVRNTLFSLDTLEGIQLTPDSQLTEGGSGSGVSVTGIANTAQARVEVRQYQQLIYSTLVPAGPFRLDDLPVQNFNAPLDVTVVETQGEKQQFIVPVTQLTQFTPRRAPGYSLAVGRLKNSATDGSAPAILTLNQNWQPNASWSLQSGTLIAQRYHSVALSLNGVPQLLAQNSSFSLQAVLAQENYQHNRGAQLRFSSTHRLPQNIALSLGVSKNTPNFITLNEALQRGSAKSEQQNSELSLSASWSPEWLGSVALSYNRARSYHYNQLWRYTALSWNYRFNQRLRLSLSASRGSGGGRKNSNLMLNLNWSLGGSSVRNYYRAYNQRKVAGTELNAPLTEYSDYSLAVEQNDREHNRSLQGALNSDLRYTRLNLSGQRDNQKNSHYSVSALGAVAFYPWGVSFSNSPVADTWGVLSLSRPLAGVPVVTAGGTAWTDWQGNAVIPYIPPWQDSALSVDVDRLPKNIDVMNGHRTLHLARGTVKKVQMTLLSGIRLLLNVKLADGRLLPKDSTLWEGDRLVAQAVDEGVVYLSNAASQASLQVRVAHTKEQCTLRYQLDDASDNAEMLFNRMDVICQ